MSYILDALRKSDQQRRLGAAPSLSAAPPAETARPPSERAGWLPYVAGAAVLVGLGFAIGAWRPWQPAVPAGPAAQPLVATPQATSLPALTPVSPAPAPLVVAAAPSATPVSAPVVSPTVSLMAPTPVAAKSPPATILADSPARQVAARSARVENAPESLLPTLAITVHAYAAEPAERRVRINQKLLREGDELAAGIRVEQITEDGVVLNVHGRRVRRGLH